MYSRLTTRSTASTLILTIAMLLLLQSSVVVAETRPVFCNRGSHSLNVGLVQDYWFEGTRYWKEEGWWNIAAGRCESLPVIPEYRLAGYAFLAFRNEQVVFPRFSPGAANTQEDISSSSMCADPGSSFKYAAKLAEEIGQRCAVNGFSVPFSFFYSTNRINIGQETIENLTINLDWDYDSLSAQDIPEKLPPVSLSESELSPYAKKLRPKFILATFVDTVYEKKEALDSRDFYFGSPDLAGHVEIDALHALLNQTLDYLNQHHIGKNSIGDKYALRQAILPGYDIDKGLKQIAISEFGSNILEELAGHLMFTSKVDEMEQYFVDNMLTDMPLRSSAEVAQIGRVPLSAKQLNEFLSGVTQEIASDTKAREKARKIKKREEEALKRKQQKERQQKAQRLESNRIREELAQAARDASLARAKKTAENLARREQLEKQQKINAEKTRARKLEMERLARENPDREKRISKSKLSVPAADDYQKQLKERRQRLADRRAGKIDTQTTSQTTLSDSTMAKPSASGILQQAFRDSGHLRGEASGGSEKWPFLLNVLEFNRQTGNWTGTIEWTSLDSVHRVEGTASDRVIAFTETQKIRKGDAKIGCEYSLQYTSTLTKYEGAWSCGQSGSVWIDLE